MTFTNAQIPVGDLPSIDEITFTDLDPAYARIVLGLTVVFEAIILTAATVFFSVVSLPDPPQPGTLAMFGVAAVGLMALIALYQFKATRAIVYAVREHDLVLRHGLFWQNEVIQPLKRIQHVELTRGPLDRRAGLAKVGLFSAGSGKATFSIPGLRLRTAARLRRYMLQNGRH